VFTARYALSPYIKQIRFVFKGLNSVMSEFVSDELESSRRKWLWPVSWSWREMLESLRNTTKSFGQNNLSLGGIWNDREARALTSDHAGEICALLGYNAASIGNPLPTFRDNVSVPSSSVKKSKKSSGSDHAVDGFVWNVDTVRHVLLTTRNLETVLLCH
jgi:hypothetical protein